MLGCAVMTTSALTAEEMASISRQIADQPMGSMVIGGNWPVDDGQVGGCECFKCGGIFLGNEWRFMCKRCADYEAALKVLELKEPK